MGWYLSYKDVMSMLHICHLAIFTLIFFNHKYIMKSKLKMGEHNHSLYTLSPTISKQKLI